MNELVALTENLYGLSDVTEFTRLYIIPCSKTL